jgi:ribosomal protein L7/L12
VTRVKAHVTLLAGGLSAMVVALVIDGPLGAGIGGAAFLVVVQAVAGIRSGWRQHAVPATLAPVGLCALVPGPMNVVLDAAGDTPITVMKVVCEELGIGMAAAATLVEGAPSVLAAQVAEPAAERLRDRLGAAGATVRVEVAWRPDQVVDG